jgi:hypothetical protein
MNHYTAFDVSKIEYVEKWVDYEPEDQTGWALFRLYDGRWGVFSESTDYTGHG